MKRFYIISVLSLLLFIAGTIQAPGTAQAGEVTVMAVGDILPHASWQTFQIPAYKLYENVVETFFAANIVIGNLECPLTDRVMPTSTKTADSVKSKENFLFKAEANETAEGLRDAGFTVLTLANNHMLDYREEGLTDTIDRLSGAGVRTTGAGKDLKAANMPCVVDMGGVEVVVIAASDVVPRGYEAGLGKPGIASMKNDNEFIKRVADERRFYPDAILVLSLHWGTEATYQPTTRQKEMAHRLVDAGADLIIGHHPHRMQGIEIYNGRPIFYSLGNFQFDTRPPGDESFIASLVYHEGSHEPSSLSIIPVKIGGGGSPSLPEPGSPEYASITDTLDRLCSPFGLKLEGGKLMPAPVPDEQDDDYWGT